MFLCIFQWGELSQTFIFLECPCKITTITQSFVSLMSSVWPVWPVENCLSEIQTSDTDWRQETVSQSVSVYFLASVGEVGRFADILQMLSLGSLSFISFGTFINLSLRAASQGTEDWVTGRSYEMRCEGKKSVQKLFVFQTFQQIFPLVVTWLGRLGGKKSWLFTT